MCSHNAAMGANDWFVYAIIKQHPRESTYKRHKSNLFQPLVTHRLCFMFTFRWIYICFLFFLSTIIIIIIIFPFCVYSINFGFKLCYCRGERRTEPRERKRKTRAWIYCIQLSPISNSRLSFEAQRQFFECKYSMPA